MLNLKSEIKVEKDSGVFVRSSKENHPIRLKSSLNSMFKFFPAELWQVDSNGTPQGLWVGHCEGM